MFSARSYGGGGRLNSGGLLVSERLRPNFVAIAVDPSGHRCFTFRYCRCDGGSCITLGIAALFHAAVGNGDDFSRFVSFQGPQIRRMFYAERELGRMPRNLKRFAKDIMRRRL